MRVRRLLFFSMMPGLLFTFQCDGAQQEEVGIHYRTFEKAVT